MGIKKEVFAVRCPECHNQPEAKIENKTNGFKITLQCERHGHMAMGDSMGAARQNWNAYIEFVSKAA